MFKLIVVVVLLTIAIIGVVRFGQGVLAKVRGPEPVDLGRVIDLTQQPDTTARRQAAVQRIQDVNADYGAKATDISYVIENQALFDISHPAGRNLAIVQQRAQDADLATLPLDQLEALAAELRVAYQAAVAQAEQLGLAALGERRDQGEKAAKLARKAASTSSDHERAALLAQCQSIIAVLGLTIPEPSRGVLLAARRGQLGTS